MRQRMMASLMAAFVGGSAFGQAPVVAVPAAPAPAVVHGNGGCTSCGSTGTLTGKHSLFGKVPGPFLGPIGKGTEMPITCSCYAAEKTFAWGSCKQFFNPGNQCGPKGCGLFGHQQCPLPVYGPGLGTPANNCAGPFTYINR